MEGTTVVVVGAGVIGLSVAVRLAESGHTVSVLAREMPLETTSARAAAIWYPYRIHPFDRAFTWAGASLAEFSALADDPASGVALRRGVELLREPSSDPWWGRLVPALRRPASVPPPYADGYDFVAPVIDMPVYLRWLLTRLEALGVGVRRVDLEELPTDVPVVVNCCGLGARALVGDSTVMPVRGQTLIVTQVGLDSWLLDGDGLTYVIPRSHDIVVGGSDEEGSWDTTVDPGLAARMLGRATALEPRLFDAEVVGHSVGLRPARPEVRLEIEHLPTGQRVVHCYGHGGAGVTVSWGCADEVLQLVGSPTLASI